MSFNLTIGKFSVGFGSQPATQPAARTRSFSAANITRLNSDWLMPRTDADSELQPAIVGLRARSRELERNNEIIQRYLSLLDNNVLGAGGVQLQMKIMDQPGVLDRRACDLVLNAWREWGQRQFCTVSGSLTWRELEGMVLRRTAADGGILVRHMRMWNNKFKYAVQVLEIDHLDSEYNMTLQNGNEIRFGVEFDQWKRVVAFHMFAKHPGNTLQAKQFRIRIPAEELIHIFLAERPGQTVGIPWATSVMQAIEHLGKYREAELVAARLEACKGYAIEQDKPTEWNGDTDDAGRQIEEMQPGMGLQLEPGQRYVPINPQHPNTAFGEFNKSALRSIAGGLAVNYNSLANDLESVNYSSMRAGKLEEIEEYKGIQSWLIDSLHSPVFTAWLEMALASGAVSLPMTKFDKFNAPDWKPRRWPWVDPLKDLQAAELAVDRGFKSRREIISEMGGDIEKVMIEQAEDEKLAAKYGLNVGPQKPAAPAAPVNDNAT